jgi:hypothetical protein
MNKSLVLTLHDSLQTKYENGNLSVSLANVNLFAADLH